MRHSLVCSLEGDEYDPMALQTVSKAGRPLWADYGLTPAAKTILAPRNDIWRYAAVLPDCEPLTLGEGMTPLIEGSRLGDGVFVKDEGMNPTSSFKARGMAVAVAMAKKLGARHLAVPSAGNAAGALSAYCAAGGLKATVFMPSDTPAACVQDCRCYGAEVVLVDGLITDCAAELASQTEARGWFDMSTLKEPYRLEGKKTMGYELAEQFDWRLPEVVVYPTGGGTGLIGMGKAFDELQALGWIGSERPRMVVVQAENCCPIVTAHCAGERFAVTHENASTCASGLRVPRAVGDFLMTDLVNRTGGTALTVSDAELLAGAREIAEKTGVFACPEGGATLAAYRKLSASGWIKPGERTVLFNTGSGIKYLDLLAG